VISGGRSPAKTNMQFPRKRSKPQVRATAQNFLIKRLRERKLPMD
jgi:hypothetical protein